MPSAPPDMANMPLAPPPKGVESNFDNPEDRRPMGIALCAVILALMLLASMWRTYSKAMITKRFGWDDWVCLIAVAFTIGYTAIAFDSLRQPAIGIHAWDIRVIDIPPATNYELVASSTIYPVGLFTVKLSIFLLLYKIFGIEKKSRYLVFFGIGVSAIFYLVTMILVLVWCAPAPGEDIAIAVSAQTCQQTLKLSAIQAGFNAVSDFYIILIALPVIWDLRTSLGRKIKVGSVFVLGLVASVLSVLNLYYRITTYHSKDPTWDNLNILICSIYEMNIGLICACMPCFPSLLNTGFAQGLLSIRSWLSWSFLDRLRSTSNLDPSRSGITTNLEQDDSSERRFARPDPYHIDDTIKQTNTFELSEMRTDNGNGGYSRI